MVFDNCEQLLDAADLIDTIVATSREPLGVATERVWPVRSLDAEGEGVELFVARATTADATFALGEDRAVLAELCLHLDDIPPAIEIGRGAGAVHDPRRAARPFA